MAGFDRSVRRLALLAAGLALGLGACGPAWRNGVHAAPGAPALLGVWSLTDNDNVLFNLRLEVDGRATVAAGSRRPAERLEPLSVDALMEQGRWYPWANGVRVDSADGWTDTILLSPAGPVQWSWAPGADRNGPPTNHGKAVRVEAGLARAVGVYRIWPSQGVLPPYIASLLANGQAFNSIDAIQGGSWRLQGSRLTVDWASRWRTVLELGPSLQMQAQHWAPGVDRNGPPTAVRRAERLH